MFTPWMTNREFAKWWGEWRARVHAKQIPIAPERILPKIPEPNSPKKKEEPSAKRGAAKPYALEILERFSNL